MMNHHMPAGPGQQHMNQGPPMYPQSRRQQEYHAHAHPYHHPPPPQSPMHAPYGYSQQQYYPHPAPPPQHHFQPRWQPSPYQQQWMPPPPPQQAPYQPRSPVVVTSQPYAQNMTPVPRQNPMPHPPPQQLPVAQSPRPILHHVPPQMHTPVAPPSPAPTPKQEQEQAAPPQRQEQTPPPQPQPQPPSRRESTAVDNAPSQVEHFMPLYPKLPWYSYPDGKKTFPARAPRQMRRRQDMRNVENVALPAKEKVVEEDEDETVRPPPSETSTVAPPSEAETPATSQAPSEIDATSASTPITPAQAKAPSPKSTPTQAQHGRRDTRTAIAVPNIPGIAKPRPSPPAADKQQAPATPADAADASAPTEKPAQAAPALGDAPVVETEGTQTTEEAVETPESPAPKPAPKSWADLVRRTTASSASAAAPNGATLTNGAPLPKSASLADALKQYSVENDRKLAFLEPRGLVNTGNMCYMNSILQVLVFCTPFYSFLDQVRQRTVHSMKSNTPLVDAMIMFMREFQVLASAESVDVLRMLLNQQQLEQYGEAFTPEYVYDAIRKLDRFSSMRRGHQQDAEEFLGFLLEGLHDECVKVMQSSSEEPQENGVTSPSAVTSPTAAEGWLEVGPRQKASTTRTAGSQDAPTPVTKIFGGHLRSELRVPGLKDSVTLEPYKPLQLDIGAPHVNNIVDALKGLTRTEALTGDFGGRSNSAKKQVFIDTLPPVLILHLKRFQYENNLTGTQKIWKKVGYPLELEIPKDVFPPSKRGGLAVKGGLPKYRLTSVVYHHGKSAAGGHYTVDVLREDGKEWVRLDDTVIRRIRPEDVAEGGAEEDPKLLAKALEQHKADQDLQKQQQQQRNIFQGLDEADREPEEERPWSEVNGHVMGHGHRKWSSVANTNGTATPASTTGKQTPKPKKEGVRDSKVAYILLYERLRS